MGKKRYWMDEDLARAIQKLVGKDALSAENSTDIGVQHKLSSDRITCVLHDSIVKLTDQVEATPLLFIEEDSSKKAFQVVVDYGSTDPFNLVVNGVSVGPFDGSTTTAEFRAAIAAVTSPVTPDVMVIHGNFFLYPVVTVLSTDFKAEVFDVPWIPSFSDQSTVKVGSRLLVRRGQYMKGSVQCAEYVSGFGYAICAVQDDRFEVIYKEDLFAAVHPLRDPSIARAYILEPKEGLELRRTPRTVQVVNRFKNISIDKGIYGRVEKVNGLIQPYVADCPDDDSESSQSVGE